MLRADRPAIPADSPLAVGWRAAAVDLLLRHGILEMLDVVSAYAEWCMDLEPDTAHDPLDCPATMRRFGDPARRRINAETERLAAEKRALPRLQHPSRIRTA
jgi:hypothetical protein